jgi:hypothetical protein
MKWLIGLLDVVEESLHVLDPFHDALDAWSRIRFRWRLAITVWVLLVWALLASGCWPVAVALIVPPALVFSGRFVALFRRVMQYRARKRAKERSSDPLSPL